MTSTPVLTLTSPEISVEQVRQSHLEELEAIARYRRSTNYLAAAQIYLKDNVLLKEPRPPENIKDGLLGHRGTSPGINLVYANLNRRSRRYNVNMFMVTGASHGAPANLANLYMESSMLDFYLQMTLDAAGLHEFIKQFSWPGGLPSHLYPGIPGTINAV